MNYDNVTNALRIHCGEMTQKYSVEYDLEREQRGKSSRFYRYLVTSEMQYKLGTLVGIDFEDFQCYKQVVRDLMDIHFDTVLKGPLNNDEGNHVRLAEAEFFDFLETVSQDCPAPDYPYCRVISGDEADEIAYRILEKWDYVPGSYWYPLTGTFEETRLYISPQWLESHWDEIHRLLDLPHSHIYEYGESWYGSPHCAEVDEINEYGGCEAVYCPKDFSWIIYFSHENTVTFAGSIVPGINKILSGEKDHWNRWDD